MNDYVREFREDAKNYRELAELHYQMATVYARLGLQEESSLSLKEHKKCMRAVDLWNEAANSLEGVQANA